MSQGNLVFIIPVRHQLSVSDWEFVKGNIQQTFASINGQSIDNWRCLVVANTGADLPCLPCDKFKLISVTFPYKKLPSKINNPDLYHDLIREDKGLRVYEAIKECNENDFFMVVDYDDFVHTSLTEYVWRNSNSGANGWLISSGYLYSSGVLALKHNTFDEVCGTSNIVKVSFLDRFRKENGIISLDVIKELLGSHRFIKFYMKENNLAYNKLPFPGAVYNIGLPHSSSQTPDVLKKFFSPGILIRKPWSFLRNISNLRFFTKKIKSDFNIYF